MTQHTHRMVDGERVDLTPEEIAELETRDAINLAGADTRKAVEVRSERNAKLAASDWTQVADVPVDKAAWATYRQSLRDITKQTGFPWTVEWPVQP